MNHMKSYRRAAEHAVEDIPDQGIRTALGLVSIAVGATELLAPKRITRMAGVNGRQSAGIVRVLGVRELMHAADLLLHHDPAPGLWSRVAGDMLDGIVMGLAATKSKRPSGLATLAALVLPVVLADMVFAPRVSGKN
jgi:uncharacterized protein YjeT (DUF2065 family)